MKCIAIESINSQARQNIKKHQIHSIYTPKILAHALYPITILFWILGISVFEYPSGTPRTVLSRIYAAIVLILYFKYASITASIVLDVLNYNETQFSESMLLGNLFWGYMILGTICFYLGHTGYKKMNNFVNNIGMINDDLYELGIPKQYDEMLRSLLLRMVFLFGIVAALFYEDMRTLTSIIPNSSWFHQIIFIITSAYPTFVTLLSDTAHMNANMILKRTFGKLNVVLSRLQTVYSNEFPKNPTKFKHILNESFVDIGDKAGIVYAIRVYYREVRRASNFIAEFYGWKTIIAFAVTFLIILMNTYQIILLIIRNQNSRNILLRVGWLLVYIIQFIMIVTSSVAVTAEAERTGRLLHAFVEPGEKLQLQLQGFSLELIQNPLYVTASDGFAVEYNFLFRFLGSVITYLVLLFQGNMKNT